MFLVCKWFAQVASELIQLPFPKRSIVLDPGPGIAQGLGPQAAAAHATVAFNRRQSRSLKDAQVLGYGGQRHREGGGDVADRALTGRQPGENSTPRRVRQRGEGGVQFRVIVNHLV